MSRKYAATNIKGRKRKLMMLPPPELFAATRARREDIDDIQEKSSSGGAPDQRDMLLRAHPQIASTPWRSASKVPSPMAVRIDSISCNVQPTLWMLTRRGPVGSPTWNRWRM